MSPLAYKSGTVQLQPEVYLHPVLFRFYFQSWQISQDELSHGAIFLFPAWYWVFPEWYCISGNIFFQTTFPVVPTAVFLCRMTPGTFTHAHYTILWSLQQTFPKTVIYRQKTIIWFRRGFQSKRHHFECLKHGTWARQHFNICKIVYNHYLILHLINLLLYMLYLCSIWQCKCLFSIPIKPIWIDGIKSVQFFFSCSHYLFILLSLFCDRSSSSLYQ